MRIILAITVPLNTTLAITVPLALGEDCPNVAVSVSSKGPGEG